MRTRRRAEGERPGWRDGGGGVHRGMSRWAALPLPTAGKTLEKDEFVPVPGKVCFDRGQLENGTVPLCGFMTIGEGMV